MRKIFLILLLLPFFTNAQYSIARIYYGESNRDTLYAKINADDSLFRKNEQGGYDFVFKPGVKRMVQVADVIGNFDWNNLDNKPSTFPATAHNHSISDVTSLQSSLDGKASASHNHAISDVTNLQTSLDGKLATNGNGSSLTGLTKSQVGLSNADNTSDASKPVSTATQAALNAKQNSLPSITGQANKFMRVNAGATDYEYVTLSGGGDALTSNPLSQFAATTSAQLSQVLSDEVGTLGGFVRTAHTKLGSDYTNATTTGTEITGLQITATGTGLVQFEYFLLVQSSATTTGWKIGVNYTGAATVLAINMNYPSTGTTAVTGVGEDNISNNAGSIYEAAAATVFSTINPNMGPTAGVAAINQNILVKVSGLINVTVGGDLEIWCGAETTGTITVKTNSIGFAKAL